MSNAIKELVDRRSKLEKDIRDSVSELTMKFKRETSIEVLGVKIDILDVSTMGNSEFIIGDCFVKLRI